VKINGNVKTKHPIGDPENEEQALKIIAEMCNRAYIDGSQVKLLKQFFTLLEQGDILLCSWGTKFN